MDPAIGAPPATPAGPFPSSVPSAPVPRTGQATQVAPTRRERWARLAGLGALAGAGAYVGLVDPTTGGAYVACPSRTLFGIDCPACGGLRGTHDLLNGDVIGALDHNLLLPLLLGVPALAFVLWLWPLARRPAPAVRLPRWALIGGAVVALGFAVLRNLPVAGLEFLASGA